MWGTGRAGQSGSTLIEMLAVVAILGLVTMLIFPQLDRATRRAQLWRDRAVMLADLRGARAQAARGGRSVSFEISADGRGYESGGRRIRTFEGERLDGEPSAVAFFPDGSSNGARWVLAAPVGRLAVIVEPETGLVRDPGAS
jgi:prepilin-type N-terminal cleavage/methylation domain-containing protein